MCRRKVGVRVKWSLEKWGTTVRDVYMVIIYLA